MKRRKKKTYKPYINEDALGWSDETSVRSKCCKSKLYIKIFRNKSNLKQIGLYCSKCNKWHSFINEDDVFYYVGCRCKVVNTYGSLKGTKLDHIQKFIYSKDI